MFFSKLIGNGDWFVLNDLSLYTTKLPHVLKYLEIKLFVIFLLFI